MAERADPELERRRAIVESTCGMFAHVAPGRNLSEEFAAARRFRVQMDAARRLDLITDHCASEELIFDRRVEVWSEEMAAIEGELRAVEQAAGERD
jgi:hypothetical protein